MAVILPFEVPIYEKEHVPVKFLGHPLVEHVKTNLDPNQRRAYFGLNREGHIIGIMPGSRQNEIKHHLPTLLLAAEKLSKVHTNLTFILPLATTLTIKEIEPYLAQTTLNIKIINENHYDALAACDAVMVASGTATLEIALLGIPMVIIYKSSRISFALAKRLVKVTHVGLCNIIAGETVVQELLQEDAHPENIANEISRFIDDIPYRDYTITKLKNVRAKLEPDARNEHLADMILQMI